MDNQKIENQLNLAIDATSEERRKSMDLNVGFDRETARWQVIVKFFGTENELRAVLAEAFPIQFNMIGIQDLIGKYAILEVPENIIDQVATLPEIEYMEKPKRLFFAVNNGRSASCINPLQTGASTLGRIQNGVGIPGQMVTPPAGRNSRNNLTGRNVIVAIIDSGERVIIMSS